MAAIKPDKKIQKNYHHIALQKFYNNVIQNQVTK